MGVTNSLNGRSIVANPGVSFPYKTVLIYCKPPILSKVSYNLPSLKTPAQSPPASSRLVLFGSVEFSKNCPYPWLNHGDYDMKLSGCELLHWFAVYFLTFLELDFNFWFEFSMKKSFRVFKRFISMGLSLPRNPLSFILISYKLRGKEGHFFLSSKIMDRNMPWIFFTKPDKIVLF